MKKWRELFAVSQASLGEKMLLSSSAVISDYESGRRKSPGAKFIRRFVWALLTIDEEKGSRFIREFAKLTSSPSMANTSMNTKRFQVSGWLRLYLIFSSIRLNLCS